MYAPFAPSFSREVNNLGTPPLFNTPGTSITLGASNADGSVTALLGALDFDVENILIGVNSNSASATDTSSLLSIVGDPAGGTAWDTTNPLIPFLPAGFVATGSSTVFPGRWWQIPRWIKAGTSIGALGRNVTGSTRTVRCVIWALGGNRDAKNWWCATRCDAFLATAASSKGATITPGNAGAFSAWANVGSATPRAYEALVVGVQGIGTVMQAICYGIEIGLASVKIGPTFFLGASSTTEIANQLFPNTPIYHHVPEGAQLMQRGNGQTGTSDTLDLHLHGLC